MTPNFTCSLFLRRDLRVFRVGEASGLRHRHQQGIISGSTV